MQTLDQIVVGDDFNLQPNAPGAATLQGVIDSAGGYFNVTGAAVYVRLQFGRAGQGVWTKETRVPIGGGILAKGTSGIAFRNAVAGQAATVDAALAERSEPAVQIAATGQAAAASTVGPSIVTVLPASPTDGEEVILTDNVASPTFAWTCQWVAAANLWIVTGGSPAESQVDTSESRNSIAYGNCATVGPTFTTPAAGFYELAYGCNANVNSAVNNAQFMAPVFSAAAAADADAAQVVNGDVGANFAGSLRATIMRTRRFTIAKGFVVTMQYRQGTAAANSPVSNRWLTALPIFLTP